MSVCNYKWIAMLLSLYMCAVMNLFLKKKKKGKSNIPHFGHLLNHTSESYIIYQLWASSLLVRVLHTWEGFHDKVLL